MCNGEGEYVCHDNKCICQCADEYPQCNCPFTDIQIMEKTLLGMSDAWAASYKDFEASGKTKSPPESQRSSELLQFPEIESAPGRAAAAGPIVYLSQIYFLLQT